MTSRPRLSRLDLWHRHETFVLEVFREALDLLRADPPLECDEPALNRQLYFKIVHVVRQRINAGLGALHNHPPTWEGQNPPSSTTEGTGAEAKRPDFYWGYIDNADPDPERSVRNLVIECKRLGLSKALNRNYVRHGVARFVDASHAYGKDVASGAMVGYVQEMTIEAILTEVNNESQTANLPELTSLVSAVCALRELEQHLEREFHLQSFRLHHLWIDLRAVLRDGANDLDQSQS